MVGSLKGEFMTRLWTIAFSFWALIGLIAYKPHILFDFQKYSLNTKFSKTAPKPKLRKLAKSYKVKKKHAQLLAKLNKTKKIKSRKNNLEEAFQTLAIVPQSRETKPSLKLNEPNLKTTIAEKQNTNSSQFKVADLSPNSDLPSTAFEPLGSNETFLSPPTLQGANLGTPLQADTIDSEFSESNDDPSYLTTAPLPEPNDSIWNQDDLMTAFDQININVLQFGADYKSAFRQLSDDVMASATSERLKGQMLDQIQKEFDAYTAYFDGSQISSL